MTMMSELVLSKIVISITRLMNHNAPKNCCLFWPPFHLAVSSLPKTQSAAPENLVSDDSLSLGRQYIVMMYALNLQHISW